MLGHRFTVVFRRTRLLTTDPAVLANQCLKSRGPLYQAARCYATPGRPKKAVGEPSRPVKRAVKRAAKAATDADSPAQQKLESRRKSAGTKKSTDAKTSKAKAPKKPVKKVVKKRVLKQPTEEQKARRALRSERMEVRELKKAALSPPKINTRANAYLTFACEKAQELKGQMGGDKDERNRVLADRSKRSAAEYKQLTPADIEHYNHLAHTHLESQQATYKSWVESHTPEEIESANRARATLRRKLPVAKYRQTAWAPIRDERASKRPVPAYAQFTMNRNASGDFRNISFAERSQLIGKEWRALSTDEKKKYQDLAKQDRERYVEEYSSTFGHSPSPVHNGVHLDHEQPQAAAAAA